MSKVVVDVSTSLDGFIAGTNDEIEPLHDWLFAGDEPSRHSDWLRPAGSGREILDEAIDRLGASVSGRRTYEVSEGWGGRPLFDRPHFVVSHRPAPEGAEAFTFVPGGVESAVEQARAVAGDGHVALMGASVVQQGIRAGLVDEIQLHVVPVLLGRGIRLFDASERLDLELTRVLGSPGVTHLRYHVR